MEVGLGPGHIVLDRDPAFLPNGGTAPTFEPMSVVAKRSPIWATAEHVLQSSRQIVSTLQRALKDD